MTDHDHLDEDQAAAVLRMLDGLQPLAQRAETRAFIAGQKATVRLLAGETATDGDETR